MSAVRALLLVAVGLASSLASGATPPPPHLTRRGPAPQLVVQGRPFLLLAGELYNSSSSNLAYSAPILPRLAAQHLNTVLAPVSWEQFEPVEGSFDFTLVDGLIAQARQHRLRLVLLWFGTWKNMVSSYAPEWVRRDPQRFPLVVDAAGNRLPIPSPFSPAGQAADARAFAALLKHLRAVDESEQTVIMVQVENEVGLPDALRDRSAAAQAAFAGPLPAELATLLRERPAELTRELRAVWEKAGARTTGSWTDVFGDTPAASELFMAWHYARYINAVAAAGRAAYRLPLFVNAAIGRKDGAIGSYPGGGALPLAFNLWRLAAPEIEMLSPDIYYGDFAGWCRAYRQLDNPFFIPETRGGEAGAANAFLAIGAHQAIGFSPFGIDHPTEPPADEFVRAYDVLAQLSPLILAHQGDGAMSAVLLTPDHPTDQLTLGGYSLEITLRRDRKANTTAERGYALVIADRPNGFVVAGKDVQVVFATPDGKQVVELGKVEEGSFRSGSWAAGRRLNGDEIMLSYDLSGLAARNRTGTGLRLGSDGPAILRVDVFTRP